MNNEVIATRAKTRPELVWRLIAPDALAVEEELLVEPELDPVVVVEELVVVLAFTGTATDLQVNEVDLTEL